MNRISKKQDIITVHIQIHHRKIILITCVKSQASYKINENSYSLLEFTGSVTTMMNSNVGPTKGNLYSVRRGLQNKRFCKVYEKR